MKYILLFMLALTINAGEVSAKRIDNVQDAMAMVGNLPDPLVTQHLHDFFASANSDEAGQVLMHIAIGAVRPARDIVVPMLAHNDPLVAERALRAMTAVGVNSVGQRETIERLLNHDKEMVGIQAATCLGSGEDVRAAPALIAALSATPEVAGAALRALNRLSGADFKTDKTAWQAWYSANRFEAAERLNAIAQRMNSEDAKEQLSAIQALGGMRTDRLEAVDMLVPMLQSTESAIVLATRQSLASLAPDQYSMPTTREVAALTRVEPPPNPKPGVIDYLANKGFFDTWQGLLVTAITVIGLLALVLFLLRSPPVKNVTKRFARVVVAGTARFARPLTSRIKRGTARIAKSIKSKRNKTTSDDTIAH